MSDNRETRLCHNCGGPEHLVRNGKKNGPGACVTMSLKLKPDCQLEGAVCRRTTQLGFVRMVLQLNQRFQPVRIPSNFQVGHPFKTFLQYPEVGPVGSPASPGKEHADLRSSTHSRSHTDTLNDFNTEDGITKEEWSDMQIDYISSPKLRQEIR